VAHFLWLKHIQGIADDREKLRLAREKLIEIRPANMKEHPYWNANRAGHREWIEDISECHKIEAELRHRFDEPAPAVGRVMTFEDD